MTQELPTSTDMTLRDYLALLRRRRFAIGIAFLVVAGAAALYLAFAPRVYQSSSSLLVEGSSPNYSKRGADEPFGDLYGTPPAHTAATAAQILSAPEFLNTLYGQAKLTPDDVTLKAQQAIGTDVVTISAYSGKPQLAKKLADMAPASYVQFATNLREQELDNTLAYAKKRLAQKSAELSSSEMDLQRFQDRYNIADLTKQRDAAIAAAAKQDTDIRDLKVAIDAAQAKLSALGAVHGSTAPGIDSHDVVTNPRIEEAKKHVADLEAERAKALTYYKAGDAHIQEIDAQIKSARSLLSTLPPTLDTFHRQRNPLLLDEEKQIADLRTSIASHQAALAKSQAESAIVAGRIDRFNSLARQLSDIERTVDADKQTVVMLTANIEGLSLRQQATHTAGVVVAPASVAQLVTPNVPITICVAILLGLLAGLAAALIQENLDTRIRREEAHRILGAPVLGMVPLVRAKGEWLYTPPYASYLLECYRVLRTNLLAAAKNRSGFSILLTSTQSGEGKTITAANVAIVLARSGMRVSLVDSDLRAAAIHEQFGLDVDAGLTDVLAGDLSLEAAMKTTPVDGLRVLTAGSERPNAGELLNSPNMRRTHQQLRDGADVVVFDGPPLLSGADSLLIAPRVDGLVYIVQEGEVAAAALRYSADLLRHCGAHVMGVVYNKVDDHDNVNERYAYRNRRYQEIPVDEAQRYQQETADWVGNAIVKHIVLAAAPGAVRETREPARSMSTKVQQAD